MGSGIRPQHWGMMCFAGKVHHSWLEHHTPFASGAQRTAQSLAVEIESARPSGIQESNLRPRVPPTSPYFASRAEFALEWFRDELVGMTTKAGAMESIGNA